MVALKDRAEELIEKWDTFFSRADWLNPRHYEFPKNTTHDRWAWEFLKRNSSFLDDLENVNFLADYYRDRKDVEVRRRLLDFRVMNREFVIRSIVLADLVHSAAGKDAESVRTTAKHLAIEEKWGIDRFYLPIRSEKYPVNLDSPCLFKTGAADVATTTYHFIDDESKSKYHIEPYVEHELLYKVNLNWPIESQINHIKHHAITNQKLWKENGREKPVKQVRLHVSKFPVYLRVFDGFESGATAKEIADSVANGLDEKGIYNADRAARRLIEGDYRFIVQTRPVSKNNPK